MGYLSSVLLLLYTNFGLLPEIAKYKMNDTSRKYKLKIYDQQINEGQFLSVTPLTWWNLWNQPNNTVIYTVLKRSWYW